MPEDTVVQRAQTRYTGAPDLADHYVILSLVVGAVLVLGYFARQVLVPTFRNADPPPFVLWEAIIWLGVGLALLAPQTLYRVMHALLPFLGKKSDA